MLAPIYTNNFAKDVKRMQKRSKNMEKLKAVIEIILQEQPLSVKYKDHQLLGNYKDRRECHIEPDWLLIYKFKYSYIRMDWFTFRSIQVKMCINLYIFTIEYSYVILNASRRIPGDNEGHDGRDPGSSRMP